MKYFAMNILRCLSYFTKVEIFLGFEVKKIYFRSNLLWNVAGLALRSLADEDALLIPNCMDAWAIVSESIYFGRHLQSCAMQRICKLKKFCPQGFLS